MPEKIFNFTSLRPPKLVDKKKYIFRYIRDQRPKKVAKVREGFKNVPSDENEYPTKVTIARNLMKLTIPDPDNIEKKLDVPNPFFFTEHHYFYFGIDELVRVLRENLKDSSAVENDQHEIQGSSLDDLKSQIVKNVWWIESDFFDKPLTIGRPMQMVIHSLWDTLYVLSILAGGQRVSTNHLTDSLRALHILWTLHKMNSIKDEEGNPIKYWPFQYEFDDFEILIDDDII